MKTPRPPSLLFTCASPPPAVWWLEHMTLMACGSPQPLILMPRPTSMGPPLLNKITPPSRLSSSPPLSP
eukprot:10342896-Alexandrium_andersonii.AAC.1